MTFSEWILKHGESLQFVLFFGLLGILAIAERRVPRRPDPMDRVLRWPVNYFLTVLNIGAMGMLPVSFIGAALWAESHGWGLFNTVRLPFAVLICANLLVRAFISFLTHYLNHAVPVLWRVHRVHHLDTELDVSTTVRFHPLEFFIAMLLGVPIVVACGLTPSILMVYELLDAVVTIWSHANVRLPASVDRVLRYIVVTPDLHRVHHSAWLPETNSNFGAVFPIWDLIFGTFTATTRVAHEEMPLGLETVRGRDAHRPLWLLTSVFNRELVPERESRSLAADKLA
jgi:sterol desaturase/sphingolipid hydroxylase (fatty acid hydroxylase superfamily)